MPLEDLPIPPPDASALAAMVKRYACKERVRYGIMIEPGPGGDTALRELLSEIDQTMLPRRILVQCPPHESLSLFVSNRRLFDIRLRGQDTAYAPHSPKDAARAFASLLRKAAQDTTGLILQQPQALVQFDEVGMSVSTTLLADVLGMRDETESDRPEEDVAEEFKTIRDAAVASLMATPCLSFSQTRGPERDVAQLQNFWSDYVKRSGLEPNRGRIKHRCRNCFVVAIDAKAHLVVATKDEELWCLAIVPSPLVQKLTAGWGVSPA